jgi:prepilin-type N-terminal cleavage/methylation domain-containing protein
MIAKKFLTLGKKPSRAKGFTLTEIAIVLGIMGLILGAIWTAASSVYSNQRVHQANTAIMQIAQGVRALYATASTTGYTSVTDITPMLITAGALPSNLVNGTTLTGPFPGGSSLVIATQDGNGFVISMSGVTQQNCIAILSSVGGQGRDSGLYLADAQANGEPVISDASTTGTPLTTYLTPGATVSGTSVSAQAAVVNQVGVTQSGGCTNASNKVRFGFSLK